MNSAPLFSYLIISLCLLENAGSDFGDFLSNLPRDIGGAFSSAWETIIEVIKRPVRIKRLGYGGKRKTTTTAITSTSSTPESAETIKSFNFYPTFKGLEVPVLPTPQWSTIDEWRNLQIPRLVKVIRNEKGLSSIPEDELIDDIDIAPKVTGPASLDDEDNFGVLFFI